MSDATERDRRWLSGRWDDPTSTKGILGGWFSIVLNVFYFLGVGALTAFFFGSGDAGSSTGPFRTLVHSAAMISSLLLGAVLSYFWYDDSQFRRITASKPGAVAVFVLLYGSYGLLVVYDLGISLRVALFYISGKAAVLTVYSARGISRTVRR